MPPGDLRMALAALCGDDDLGPHVEPTWCSTGSPAPATWPGTRRQPADHRPAGSARRHRRGLWTGSARLLGARGRVLPMAARAAARSSPTSRALDPERPGARRARRGQVAVASTRGEVARLCAASRPTRRPARTPSTPSPTPTGDRARPRVLVHQRAAAPAGAGHRSRGPASPAGASSWRSTSPRSRGRRAGSRRNGTSRCWRRTLPGLPGRHRAGRPAAASPTRRLWPRPRPGSAPGSCSLRSPAATGRRGTTRPARLRRSAASSPPERTTVRRAHPSRVRVEGW